MKKRSVKKQRKIDQIARSRHASTLVVYDLEATCWEPERPERQEILEIGAVRLDAHPCEPGAGVVPEFSEVVRPVIDPVLSDFCVDLTSIPQIRADAADAFTDVFARWIHWIGPGEFWLGAWGSFDRRLIEIELARHDLAMPPTFLGYLDLRREFARWQAITPAGLKRALQTAGLEMEGSPHRALDDARNLARLTRTLLNARASRTRKKPLAQIAAKGKGTIARREPDRMI